MLGLASSGPHSNGYSLIRRVLGCSRQGADTPWPEAGQAVDHAGGTLGAALLAPTRIYVRPLLRAMESRNIRGLAHITGGGLPGNVERVLPANVDAVLHRRRWKRPAVFDWLQREGGIPDAEMLRTFNCGIGMVAIVPREEAEETAALLTGAGETVGVIGEIVAGSGRVDLRE